MSIYTTTVDGVTYNIDLDDWMKSVANYCHDNRLDFDTFSVMLDYGFRHDYYHAPIRDLLAACKRDKLLA